MPSKGIAKSYTHSDLLFTFFHLSLQKLHFVAVTKAVHVGVLMYICIYIFIYTYTYTHVLCVCVAGVWQYNIFVQLKKRSIFFGARCRIAAM